MSDTVAVNRTDPFSVERQAADLRSIAVEPSNVLHYTLGVITSIARDGGTFDKFGTSAEERLAYIRNALAAAELVRAELDAR